MIENKKKRIGIIGAGPAGLTASVTASKILKEANMLSHWQVDLIEKNAEPGKKLLATGNGKCNISNKNADDYQVIQSFFNDLGVLFVIEENGNMYPYSKQAKNIRDTLVNAALMNDVNIVQNTDINKVEFEEPFFILTSSENKLYKYEKLIITTGGKAGLQYGSVGAGYKFARSFGIEVSPILPSLVAMTYSEDENVDLKKLKGVRAKARLALEIDGKDIAYESGEIQFTYYGISGICVFNLSRYLKEAPRVGGRITKSFMNIDFIPEISNAALINILSNNPPAGLKGIVNDKIESLLLGRGLNLKDDVTEIVRLLKNFTVKIAGTKGWKEANVTSGGVLLNEINMKSMESKRIDNLFFAGEILDYEGPCGGYNLNWAWKTGISAGFGVLNGIKTND